MIEDTTFGYEDIGLFVLFGVQGFSFGEVLGAECADVCIKVRAYSADFSRAFPNAEVKRGI